MSGAGPVELQVENAELRRQLAEKEGMIADLRRQLIERDNLIATAVALETVHDTAVKQFFTAAGIAPPPSPL